MKILLLFTLISSNAVFAQTKAKTKKLTADQELRQVALENLATLPKNFYDAKKNKALVDLGKKLYFETKLSVNDKMSCNTCHNLDTYGVDNEPTSPGHEGKRGGRNSPSVYNSALHIAQFWDGRAADVEAQAIGPILNPIEMGMPSEAAVVEKIGKVEDYQKSFKQAFPKADPALTYKNIGVAIGAYERTLLTPSRFDDFLNGKDKALTEIEKKGLKRFVEIGCTSCHNGAAVGGSMYMKLGAVNEYKTEDLGRFEVTKDDADKYVFKVPSLRNVEKTAPYFHDGSIKTLDEAIKLMAWHQLGEKISEQDIAEIKAFLVSMTAAKPKY
jgi:cytochrome c peroxidase